MGKASSMYDRPHMHIGSLLESGGLPGRSIRPLAGTHDEDHRRAEWPQCFPGQDIAEIEAWGIVCREINAFSPHDNKQRRSSEAAADVVH